MLSAKNGALLPNPVKSVTLPAGTLLSLGAQRLALVGTSGELRRPANDRVEIASGSPMRTRKSWREKLADQTGRPRVSESIRPAIFQARP